MAPGKDSWLRHDFCGDTGAHMAKPRGQMGADSLNWNQARHHGMESKLMQKMHWLWKACIGICQAETPLYIIPRPLQTPTDNPNAHPTRHMNMRREPHSRPACCRSDILLSLMLFENYTEGHLYICTSDSLSPCPPKRPQALSM